MPTSTEVFAEVRTLDQAAGEIETRVAELRLEVNSPELPDGDRETKMGEYRAGLEQHLAKLGSATPSGRKPGRCSMPRTGRPRPTSPRAWTRGAGRRSMKELRKLAQDAGLMDFVGPIIMGNKVSGAADEYRKAIWGEGGLRRRAGCRWNSCSTATRCSERRPTCGNGTGTSLSRSTAPTRCWTSRAWRARPPPPPASSPWGRRCSWARRCPPSTPATTTTRSSPAATRRPPLRHGRRARTSGRHRRDRGARHGDAGVDTGQRGRVRLRRSSAIPAWRTPSGGSSPGS